MELLHAVSNLCLPAVVDHTRAGRMVALLIDGLRYGAKPWRQPPPVSSAREDT